MPVLSVHGISKSYVERELFFDVSFDIEPHDKVGFIGANGVGKTTIFRIINKEESSDTGSVSVSKDTCIGYMQQHACSHPNRSIYDEVLSIFEHLKNMHNEIDKLSSQIELHQSGDDINSLVSRQTALIEQYERDGGLTYHSRAKSALIGLGFDEEDLSKPTGTLSGGQRSKVSLCKLLLSGANLLLLDEPTNHLDIKSVSWLEGFLRDYKGEFIVISHDRFFLDAVTNKTIELEHNKITCYKGNYTEFIRKKEHEQQAVRNKYENDMRQIKRIEGIVEQQKRWGREKNFVTARSKQHQADKIKEALVTPDGELQTLTFKLTPKRESGNDVLMCHSLSKSFDKPVFNDVSMHIRKGERVFILGSNGCGKTTLFKLIKGEYEPDSGAVRFGAKVDAGYYDQMQDDLDLSKTALDEVYDEYPEMDVTQVRTVLGSFMFKGDDVFKPLSKMSGGERARISLLKLMLKGANLLLLDEPTNHLDTSSRESLEKTLDEYGGTMLIISHDRYFINKLATRVLVMQPDGVCEYIGNYDDYVERINGTTDFTNNAAADEQKKPKINDYVRQKQLLSEQRKRKSRLEKCEKLIAQLEFELDELQRKMQDEDVMSDYEKISELTAMASDKQAQLDALYDEWAELSD